ncbi:putative immunoglobulin-blocking virulence protein [Mycoplasma feriruminatoris]|uniref:putative immunoglobulin-blocking virulence protein n=1 Tax=Mycoplasma feriruminatoris TaxID=1179777 RepID=UPI00241F48F9|nr:putative immunoglobulin-blocking virulence protein [Mycoplasma feriruminatoris]WFQ90052.1 Immunoglobulin binding protein MIB [Mycoplasma feriruminatoris]
MNLLKKKKNKILAFAIIAGLMTSVSLGSTVFYSIADNSLARDVDSTSIVDANLVPINDIVSPDSIRSNRDNNIKKLEGKDLKPTVKDEEKRIIIPDKKEEKPETAIPDTSHSTPSPQNKPRTETKVRTTRKINIAGAEVEAEVEGYPGFNVLAYDQERRISNPNPYTNITVSKILNVQVTEELKTNVVNNALGEKDGKGTGLFNNTFFNVATRELESKENLSTITETLRMQHGYQDFIQRYIKLLDSPNVEKFLKEEAKKEYPSKKASLSKDELRVWLILNLDKTKFTKMASKSEAYLKQGLTIDPRNAFINEDGEIDSYGWNVPDEFNTVTSRMQRDNSTRRVFGYNQWYSRSSDDIQNGNYPGWEKEEVNLESDQTFKAYGIKNDEGFKITRLKRKDKVDTSKGQINEGIVVEIDASNPKGYEKLKSVIEQFKSKGQEITSYRIKNMGANDSGQKFGEILAALPDKLPQLELFFSDRDPNTASLIHLENKKIKELSLYTDGNSLKRAWSFNPLSFRNTEWINTIDYNVSAQYGRGQKIYTRVTFNTLAFDEKDYEGGKLQRINDGLRMAYYARNNEPVFQGAHGAGLDPDTKLGDNSYPTGLDFSRVTQIKSLKGLIFNDTQNAGNGSRNIAELTLYNNGEVFEISADELNNANMQHLSTGGSPIPPKLYFSNGYATQKMRITGNGLTDTGLENLSKYFAYNDAFKEKKTIQVDSNNSELANKLKSYGYNVENATNTIIT